MNKLDLTCPRCAATMTLDEKHEHAICEYCGHQIKVYPMSRTFSFLFFKNLDTEF